MSIREAHSHDTNNAAGSSVSVNDADVTVDTGSNSQGQFASSSVATFAGTEQAIRSDGVDHDHDDEDGDENSNIDGMLTQGGGADDDSYGTIKTTRSLKESKVANTKVEVQFGETLVTNTFSFTNTSMVKELPTSGKKPPRSSSSNIGANTRSESGFLSALTEEGTIDSVGAVGTQTEDDLYSIATERSFTGAMINLVLRDLDSSDVVGGVTGGVDSVTGGVDDSMAALEETREEDCDDQFSVMTTEVNEMTDEVEMK